MVPPTNTLMSPAPQLAQLRDHVLDQFLVAARQDAQADRVDALVDRHLRDLRRAAPQAGVDHLGARHRAASSATIFAPMSWPSSPGLPIRMRLPASAAVPS